MVLKARPATVPATESGATSLIVRSADGHEQPLLVVDQVQHHVARPDPARRFGNHRGQLRRAAEVRAPQQLVEHVRHRRVAGPGRRRARARAGAVVRHSAAARRSCQRGIARQEHREARPQPRELEDTAAALPCGATTASLRPCPLKRCWICMMAPNALESTSVTRRQIEDQARVVGRDGLVELRSESIDGIQVQLARGRDHGRLGHREGRTRNR